LCDHRIVSPSAEARHELNGRELGSWGGFLRVYGVLARELDSELTTQHGITLSDYEVLLFLASTAERRMRMSELADSVLISQSGITRLVDRLTRRGLVRRERCSADRRGLFAVLTDDGLAKLREASPTHLAGVRSRFLGRLSADEQATLGELWERLVPGTAEALSPLARRPSSSEPLR
jgi:DNA-binding MarR family transcriptional regulator